MIYLNLIPKWALIAALVLVTALLGKSTWDNSQLQDDLATVTEENTSLKADIKESQFNASVAAATNLKKLKEASDVAKRREKIHQSELAAAKYLSDGLRVSTEEARGLFQLDGTAQSPRDKLADFGYDLLERCESRYISVAGRIEEYVSYIQELRQAWPTSQACTAKR